MTGLSMKLLALAVFFLSGMTYADNNYNGKLICEGTAEIHGTFFKKTDDLRLELNYSTDPYSRIGHRASINGKTYVHAYDLSSCKESKTEIICRGYGVGNGPELVVTINKKTLEASGYYFNPWAKRIEVQNEYNTYRFERLICW